MFRNVSVWAASLLAGGLGLLAAPVQAMTFLDVQTNFGTFTVEIFDPTPTTTTANFLTYVDAGAYTRTFFHRADSYNGAGTSSFLQTGGYTLPNGAPVPQVAAPIPLEYGRANSRGTLAMARTSDPNSATSGWFINVDDNSAAFGQANGGGYAVFGKVIKNMALVDAFAAQGRYQVASWLTQVPLVTYNGQQYFIEITGIQRRTVVAGDANLDGLVTLDDYLALDSSLRFGGGDSWDRGDFNGDGFATVADYAILDASYAATHGGQGLGMRAWEWPGATTVPEPASLGLLGAGAALLWRRRK